MRPAFGVLRHVERRESNKQMTEREGGYTTHTQHALRHHGHALHLSVGHSLDPRNRLRSVNLKDPSLQKTPAPPRRDPQEERGRIKCRMLAAHARDWLSAFSFLTKNNTL